MKILLLGLFTLCLFSCVSQGQNETPSTTIPPVNNIQLPTPKPNPQLSPNQPLISPVVQSPIPPQAQPVTEQKKNSPPPEKSETINKTAQYTPSVYQSAAMVQLMQLSQFLLDTPTVSYRQEEGNDVKVVSVPLTYDKNVAVVSHLKVPQNAIVILDWPSVTQTTWTLMGDDVNRVQFRQLSVGYKYLEPKTTSDFGQPLDVTVHVTDTKTNTLYQIQFQDLQFGKMTLDKLNTTTFTTNQCPYTDTNVYVTVKTKDGSKNVKLGVYLWNLESGLMAYSAWKPLEDGVNTLTFSLTSTKKCTSSDAILVLDFRDTNIASDMDYEFTHIQVGGRFDIKDSMLPKGRLNGSCEVSTDQVGCSDKPYEILGQSMDSINALLPPKGYWEGIILGSDAQTPLTSITPATQFKVPSKP